MKQPRTKKESMKPLALVITLLAASFTAVAGERSTSTVGTVQREVTADRVTLTVDVKAREKAIKDSNAQVDRLLRELYAQVAALHYPVSSVTVQFRSARTAFEYDGK